MTDDEQAGQHRRLNGHGFGWTPGVGDGQGGLLCCSSWGRKESDMTERLNATELMGLTVSLPTLVTSETAPQLGWIYYGSPWLTDTLFCMPGRVPFNILQCSLSLMRLCRAGLQDVMYHSKRGRHVGWYHDCTSGTSTENFLKDSEAALPCGNIKQSNNWKRGIRKKIW